MFTEAIIGKYKKLYDLPELNYEERVSGKFFEFYRRRHHFVIVSIYNLKNEILLIRDFNKVIGWELPGGYVNNGESIEEAINRITVDEGGLEIDELSPVAVIKNIFKYKNNKIVHSGIAFMALSRGHTKPTPKNIQSRFTSSTPKKVAYQNATILSLVRKRLARIKNRPPFGEIDSVKGKRFFLFYLLHKYVIKRIGNLSSRKIKTKLFDLIEGRPKTILDVSCGEDPVINELYEKYKPDICVGNDISWKTITFIQNRNPAIFFTNHNVLNLSYKIRFDLVVFKNTLHHIERKHHHELMKNLLGLAKQLIIIDVDDPRKSTFRSKAWNKYYVYLLGDQGNSFLSFELFNKILGAKELIYKKLKTGIINTIKGKYFYASIENQ